MEQVELEKRRFQKRKEAREKKPIDFEKQKRLVEEGVQKTL